MPTAAPTFDVDGARKAGYSDDEILQYLAPSVKFDVSGALKAGYQPSEILGHLQQTSAVQTVPRPAPPSELAPNSFGGNVTDRIRQNVYAIPNLIEGNVATYNEGLTQPKAKAEAQQEKQQAADNARQMVTGGADSWIGKGAKMLGMNPTSRGVQAANAVAIGPRIIGNQAQSYWQNPASAVGDLATVAVPVAAEMELPVNKQYGAGPPPPPQGLLTPEQQAGYTASLDKANAPYVKQLAAEDLAQRQSGIAQRLQENVQQTHETVRNALNERWDDLRDKVGDQPVATEPILKAIDKSRQMLAGTPADLRIFNQIVQNLDQRGAEAAIEGMPTDPAQLQQWIASRPPVQQTPAGLPFNDARTQYSALGDQWSSADGNLRRALKNAYDAYGQEIQNTAEAKGAGGEYSDLKRDWSQYMQDWRGKGPLAKVLNAPHTDYVTPIAKGVGSNLLAEQMQRYASAGADPSAVAQMQATTKELPALKPVAPPPPPPPEQGLAQRIVAHIPRVVGKVVGGKIGVAMGHPLIGYGIGGEIGGEIGKRMTAPPPSLPPIPRTASEYTRTLLAAKDGEISPDEANRRIVKGGGSARVRPLPQPPE